MNGGSTEDAFIGMECICEPQWSPPMNGGSTRGERGIPGRGREAAMEPADERREHQKGVYETTKQNDAAMEPADERREHHSETIGHPLAGGCRNGARR